MNDDLAYYVLLHDSSRDDLESVEDYEMVDFDLTVFWSGSSYSGTLPDSVRILVNEGKSSDYLGNPISWILFSRRVVQIIEPIVQSHVQFIPITLYRYRTNEAISRYILTNPLGCIDAIIGKKRNE